MPTPAALKSLAEVKAIGKNQHLILRLTLLSVNIDISIRLTILTMLPRGTPGEEVEDGGFNLHHPRRRSNSFQAGAQEFKTKFEKIDPEPVDENFDEALEDESLTDEKKDLDSSSLDRVDSVSKDSEESESVDEGMKKL